LIAFIISGRYGAAFASGPDFYPEITVSGKSLDGWHTLGNAQWHAENGEIVGTPAASGGGWLIFNKSYQDINFYTQYRLQRRLRHGALMARGKDAGWRHEKAYSFPRESANDMENGGYGMT